MRNHRQKLLYLFYLLVFKIYFMVLQVPSNGLSVPHQSNWVNRPCRWIVVYKSIIKSSFNGMAVTRPEDRSPWRRPKDAGRSPMKLVLSVESQKDSYACWLIIYIVKAKYFTIALCSQRQFCESFVLFSRLAKTA